MLSIALRANALFSMLSALILVLAAPRIASLTFIQPGMFAGQTELAILYLAGAGVGIFGIFCLFLSFAKPADFRLVKAVIAADFLWVMASAALLILVPGVLSRSGMMLVGMIAILVGCFGLLQGLGLKQGIQPKSRP